MGLLHGGVYASLVEDVASVAASWWLGGRALAVGANNSTDFIRPLQEGAIVTATATPIHRGRSQQLWQVEIVTEDGVGSIRKLRLSNIAVESQT